MAGVTQDPEAWARLGAKIRERREALEWSRRQLSEVAGVSEKSIQVAEEGRTPRARWPQSLRLIETALRWEPGSMELILNGGEAEEIFDLFSIAEGERRPVVRPQPLLFPSDVNDAGEIYNEPSDAYSRSRALAHMPHALRKNLGDVLSFGRKAASHGADEEVVERYEDALEALLTHLTSRPLGYIGYAPTSSRIAVWIDAARKDPFLRRQREYEARLAQRERQRLTDQAERVFSMTAAGRPIVASEGITSAEVLQELQKLSSEVAELSKRVSEGGASRQDTGD